MHQKKLYRDDLYRTVFGPEEEAKYVARGWQDAPVEGQEYTVNHFDASTLSRGELAAATAKAVRAPASKWAPASKDA